MTAPFRLIKTHCATFPPTTKRATTCEWLNSSFKSSNSNNKIKTRIKTNRIKINKIKTSKIKTKTKTTKINSKKSKKSNKTMVSKTSLIPNRENNSKDSKVNPQTWMSAVFSKCSKPCKTKRKQHNRRYIRWANVSVNASVKPLETGGNNITFLLIT